MHVILVSPGLAGEKAAGSRFKVRPLAAFSLAWTSLAMIERVYGHFRNRSYQDAQPQLDRVRGARGARRGDAAGNEQTPPASG